MFVGVSWEAGASWMQFWGLLVPLFGPLGSFFGGLLEHLGSLLGLPEGLLGRKARVLVRVPPFGPSWGQLRALLGRLGRLSGRRGALLGRLGASESRKGENPANLETNWKSTILASCRLLLRRLLGAL